MATALALCAHHCAGSQARRVAAVGGRCRQSCITGPRADFNRRQVGQGANGVRIAGGCPSPVSSCAARPTYAGARTRCRRSWHGSAWILLFASLSTNLVNWILLAALAGLLIVIGAQLVAGAISNQ